MKARVLPSNFEGRRRRNIEIWKFWIFFLFCEWIRDLDLGFVAGEDLKKRKYLKGIENLALIPI